MIYYEGIVGSRSNNLNLITSDYDFFTCSTFNNETSYSQEKFTINSHLIHRTPKFFLGQLFLDNWVSFNIQLFFPSQLLSKTEVSDYIIQNREEILCANSFNLFQTYFNYCKYLNTLETEDWRYKKRFVYSCLYANLLINYAKSDRSFEELFVVSGKWQEYLLSIRKSKEISQEHLEKFQEMFKQLPDLKGIYEKRQNKIYLEKARNNISEMLEIK